jgi:SAM-dependent methyltransferase
MKLSALVQYLNEIDRFDLAMMHRGAMTEAEALCHLITNDPAINLGKANKSTRGALAEADQAFQRYLAQIRTVRQHVVDLIQEQQVHYLQETLRWYVHEQPFETADYIFQRRLRASDRDRELILGKVLRWGQWQYPGMCIRPAGEEWIDHLVPLDPMYLVDQRIELLIPSKERFHTQYQQRLRLYTVKESLTQPIMADLPDQQFALIFVYNFFNYRPIELINQYLHEIFQKLRPGGVLFMTYNDCDQAQGVGLCEHHLMAYTPGHMLLDQAQCVGYEVQERYTGEQDLAWLELRRPGELNSLRAGQTLAKIVALSK